jgi:hypothetical protein
MGVVKTLVVLYGVIKGIMLTSNLITAAGIILSKKKEKIESDTAKKRDCR